MAADTRQVVSTAFPELPYIVINVEDFDAETMTPYVEPGAMPAPETAPAPMPAHEPRAPVYEPPPKTPEPTGEEKPPESPRRGRSL